MDACLDPVDDVKIRLKTCSLHVDGADDTVPVDVVPLQDRVQEDIRTRECHFLGLGRDSLQIPLGNDILFVGQLECPAVIEALEVRSGDGHPDIANLDIGLVLGIQ